MSWYKGKGSPSTNNAERALLDGYRMGIAAYEQKGGGKGAGGKGAKGDGGGKGSSAWGGGKGNGVPLADRVCKREGCHAAERKKATWGGSGGGCFCCGLSLTATLPLEQLCEWAYEERLQGRREEQKTAAKQDKAPPADTPPAKNAPAAPPAKAAKTTAPTAAALTTEQLAERRTERLAAWKAAGAPQTPAEKSWAEKQDPAAVTSGVFTNLTAPEVAKTSPKKLQVPKELMQGMKEELAEQANAILDSLSEECYPWDTPMETAEAIVNKELMAVSSGHSVANQEAAEASLQGTRRSIAALDAPADDPDLAILLKRQERQEKEVARLTGKKPTTKLQKLALEDIQVTYRKKVQAAVEGTERGETKAKLRAKTREETLAGMVAKLQALQTFVTDAHKELADLHNARAGAKASQAAEVHSLIDEKIAAIDQRAAAEPDEDMEDRTEAELEKEAAERRLAQERARHAVDSAQQATAWEHQVQLNLQAQDEEKEKVQSELVAVVQQRNAEREARELVEGRLAKLEEAFMRAEQRELVLQQRATEAEETAANAVRSRRRSRSRNKEKEKEAEDKALAYFGRKSKSATPEALPDFDPQPEQFPMLGDLLAAFKRWSAEGADLPITMKTLATHTSAGAEAPNVLRTLLGSVILGELAIDVDTPEQIIPRQGMMLLLHSLDKFRDILSKKVGKVATAVREEKALTALKAMRAAQKKRPAEHSEAAPPAKQVAGSDETVDAVEATAKQAEQDQAEADALNAPPARA